MRPSLLASTLSMLAACSPEAEQAPQALAADQAPAPYIVLELPDSIIAGVTYDINVSGTLGEGELVYIGRSYYGIGSGPCPPSAGGLCLDIQAPATLAGVAYIDENGNGSISVTLPPGRAGSDVYYQAVAIRGIRGSASIKSDVVSDTILSLIYGCTDPAADNYNPSATYDDGSCTYAPPPSGGGNFQKYTWADAGVSNNGRGNAEAYCASQGATLARPDSQAEWDAIYALVPQDSLGWWIDGHNNFTCGSATPGSPKSYEYGDMYSPSGTPNMYTGCNCTPSETGLVAYRFNGGSPFDGCQGVSTSVGNLGVMDEQTTYNHPSITGFICEFPGANISVEMDVGQVAVPNSCVSGDYSCQAQAVCEYVTGTTCVFQDYNCWDAVSGSWYPTGTPGGSSFNFSQIATQGTYGNICGCDTGLFESYGLRSYLTYCGIGQWNRD